MARRIIDTGYPMTLWARHPATLEPFVGTPAKVAASPAELAAASDLVCICVVSDDDVAEVVAGEGGVLAGLANGEGEAASVPAGAVMAAADAALALMNHPRQDPPS
jgi:3-hydroxyisobutyrate dehydrogenase-like beta-hydroxyacid dehydrogenase